MRLVVLISGNGSNLEAILDAIAQGRLEAELALVVSNRAAARGLKRAALAGVPHRVLAAAPYRAAGRPRAEYDADLAALVAAAAPDVVVLAGWMHVLSGPFLARFPGRVLNLHPALPGSFPGTHAIARAYAACQEQGLTHTGVMVHLATEAVDAGPVLAQEAVPILPDDTLDALEARIHAVEHRLLVDVLAGWDR